ncbi:MAG: hypothetical protein ACYDG5_07885 [Dehalococcoidales bacterium]
MIILWIRKNKADKNKGTAKLEGNSFHDHDDIMKKFRYAHPDLTVESPRDILTAEENPLQPIQQVKLWANIQN